MAKIGGPGFYMLPIFTKNAGKTPEQIRSSIRGCFNREDNKFRPKGANFFTSFCKKSLPFLVLLSKWTMKISEFIFWGNFSTFKFLPGCY